MRRLASQPAIRTVTPRVVERGDGDVDIHLEIVEQKPYRLLLTTKFTDIDKFFGIGLTWNEFNPPALQYEARAMFGMSGHDLLTSLRARKSLLGNALRFNAAYFDLVKSRDDLDYVFTRQEVHEIGGEFSTRYEITANTAIDLGVFEKRYKPPKINNDLRVEPGTADGIRLTLDVGGTLPLQGAPRFRWKHTFYYQNTGPGEIGDFFFDTYQFNLTGTLKFLKHHEATSTIHAGWLSGTAPPQEHFSLGGMTTLPGYEDDSFVNTRVVLAGQTVCVRASNWVNETSLWAPVRLILTFHAGTVWGDGETFSAKNLRMDAGIEFDYMETLRFGVVWPTGPLRGDSPRVYIGWGVHVL
jgi:outer membrane protein assembly factor BamA